MNMIVIPMSLWNYQNVLQHENGMSMVQATKDLSKSLLLVRRLKKKTLLSQRWLELCKQTQILILGASFISYWFVGKRLMSIRSYLHIEIPERNLTDLRRNLATQAKEGNVSSPSFLLGLWCNFFAAMALSADMDFLSIYFRRRTYEETKGMGG